MHEAGIALQIVRIALGAIPDDAGKVQVRRVHLNIGKLCAVVPDSLIFCFRYAVRETRLDGAELVINEIPAMAECHAGGYEWFIEMPVFECPECDSRQTQMVSGRELEVESIEVDEQG